jgi:hypothetical protein
MLKTRFNRFAQVIEALFSAGVWSDSSGDWVFLHLPRLAGVTSARYLLLGAPKVGALGEHPVEACQVNPGLGNQGNQSGYGRSCASSAIAPGIALPPASLQSCARGIPYILYIKSSGSNMMCVAPDGDGYGLRVAQEVP